MTVYPSNGVPPNGQVISSCSPESTGSAIFHFNNTGFTNFSSGNWPSANLGIWVPFTLTQQFLVTQMWAYNGATAAANADLGIYTSDGTRLVSMGATAQSGANAVQAYNITDTMLGAGQYYMALSLSAATSAFFRVTLGSAQFWKTTGMGQQAAVGTLPATTTLVTVANDYLPLFGLTGRSFV